MFEFFTGLLPIVEHFGLGATAVAACIVAAIALPYARTTAIIGAVALSFALVSYSIGEHDGTTRAAAQANKAVQQEYASDVKARADAESSVAHSAPKSAGGVRGGKPVRAPKPLDKWDRG